MMWARAIEGRGRFPAYFPATGVIKTPEARAASVVGLKRRLAANPSETGTLASAAFLLDDDPVFEEALKFVERDLRDRLVRTAVAPQSGLPAERSAQISVLRDVVGELRRAGHRPFLVSGTLLGYVRSTELMAHDYDIDLGVLPGDADADAVVAAISELPRYTVVSQKLKVVARSPSGFSADIFVHYERDGLLWHGTDIHEWWNTPFDLESGVLHGVDVWIPTNARRYLDENYGTWERPIAFYNFSFDTPNRRYRENGDALAYLYRRCVRAIETDDRWTAESAIRELRDQFDVDLTDEVQPTPLLMPSGRRSESE
ncbi:hypothetical protein [Ilumatobacter sp.]|uniref:hypothetical protein n=1 Tax=Ilumatobacter sp. TaxID=1967498 RepID=UPI003C40B744